MSADMRIDPPECRCTDCILGLSVPANRRDALAELLAEFEMANGPVSETEVQSALELWQDRCSCGEPCDFTTDRGARVHNNCSGGVA